MASAIDIRRLAAELREKRGRQGLRSAAEEIGDVSAATLSRVEQGKIPDLDTFFKLCGWLGKSPQDFTLGATPAAGTSAPDTPSLIAAHLRADRTLSKETAEALSTVIRLAYDAARSSSLQGPSRD